MSPRPDTVTDLHAEPALARTLLSWEPLGFDPLIDHFRIYAVRGESAPEEPQESDLIAKTVYPNVAHTDLDPAGETWTYTVLAVSDAGRRGRPSAPVTASSQPSVTATGREIATIGAFDGRTLEHHLAPTSYSQIPEEFPDAVIEYEQGADEPGTAWPYLLPGPGDAWAGKTAYRARWTFTLEEAPQAEYDLAVWLVDTTRLGGILRVSANDEHVTDIELPLGSTRGSREGDATVPGSPLLRSFHEPALPAALLQAGANVIEFELAEGGWVAWDAVGVFAREE
ncbi:MAG: polysaccharide lyase family protein [Brachybacterium tyrofermentans]|uniref:polysaccharide lyase family protein n=1 Tax=Brachybacterium tyrofermentans TaxID=47848 RepID=UPI003FB72888